jgi:alkylation response protein AidB-like acyl-CoA dehydrogenase
MCAQYFFVCNSVKHIKYWQEKLAAGALGGAKGTINLSINYANEQEQFGRAISKYAA